MRTEQRRQTKITSRFLADKAHGHARRAASGRGRRCRGHSRLTRPRPHNKKLALWFTAHDPWTLLLATGGLAMVAAAAGYIPTFRASGLDPSAALRYE